ncbi:Rap1 GTPase-GDP dissociation stimulator 1 [Desmophyllum pertusum]|uniref:Rap1 GTPase-GDP dissociation stimulator 1 n=1 Tax=Desmophyllum pertusum TaxID=174260 RepID=A0A9X0CRA8_9CNID|nr:Rap1 GTPase-GDP dissociation stimulator 1 [Desmophyllum pertusum]
MDHLSELFLKLKLGVEETKGLDLGDVDTAINALQSNNEFDETTIENILKSVVALLEIDEPESKAKVLMLIAEIAKSEETRVPCVKAGLIATILSNLEKLAKSALAEHKGAEKIVKKLGVLEKSFDENSDNKLELAACGSMLNVASDDEALTEEAVSFGAVSFLLGFVKQSLHSNPALCQMALSAVSVLVFSEKGKASFSESDGVEILMKVVQESEDEEMIDTIFEIFKSLIVDDDVKKALVQQGYAEHLANIVSSSNNAAEDESVKERMQSAADMIVMLLTEDDSMKVLFDDGNGSVYKLCVSWLSSEDQHLEISGCLAVGNFARTDEHCIKLVEQGVHVQLLQLLARTTKRENMGRHQQAVFSALKNLAMPAVNKLKLVESGCLDVILPLLSIQSPFVQFKVLGTLRMLLTGHADVASRIIGSKDHLNTLVRCCESSGHEGVRSEASRMLAVIVKQARTAEVSQQIMKGGGLAPIVAMVSSEHVIMQNEALIALTVMSSTVEENYYPKFRECGIIQTLIKMIKTEGVNPQTCYNAMAVLESFSLQEYFRRDLEVAGLNKALDDLTKHENENVKKRALIILTRVKAHKFSQE